MEANKRQRTEGRQQLEENVAAIREALNDLFPPADSSEDSSPITSTSDRRMAETKSDLSAKPPTSQPPAQQVNSAAPLSTSSVKKDVAAAPAAAPAPLQQKAVPAVAPEATVLGAAAPLRASSKQAVEKSGAGEQGAAESRKRAAPNEGKEDSEDVTYTQASMKQKLAELGLPIYGSKEVLRERLRNAMDSSSGQHSKPADAEMVDATASTQQSKPSKPSEEAPPAPFTGDRVASPPRKAPSVTAAPAPRRPTGAPRTVEETYQKKSQLEHILLRPDSYVGSIEKQEQDHWVFNESSGRMVQRKLEYIPALFKIFDEILVNAADNLVRCPGQDKICVEIESKRGCISVWNNGQGIPVQMHREHNCYVPELIFGHLLTSDNYDDSEKKVVGGRNGYGAKLANIFSTRFVVETADSRAGKRYKQVWDANMTVAHPPEINDLDSTSCEDFTKITFFPDLARLGMKTLEKDIVALMKRRAFDVAASTHGRCQVYLNGEPLKVHSFEDYVALHLDPDAFRVCEVVNDRWEIAVGITDGSGFRQVSFVNSINTCRGGTHVNYIADQVISSVMTKLGPQKSAGGPLSVKPQHVRGYLMVFVNCLIENPAFDSQTKETLMSKRERFGSTCTVPEPLISRVLESGIVEALQEWSKALGKSELAQHLNRSDMGLAKRIFGVPKLEDANFAGTKQGGSCTLILTEGDSAKALAVAGLGVVGRDCFGVFPLRGKLRNVRELTVKQMMENKEIDQVMRIMALDAGKEYGDVRGLRYGSIMIMTDQDPDGSHIKGLIINFIQHWFPSLLRVPGFLKEFVTPIVKVTKGDEAITFFTVNEYQQWKEDNDGGHGWKCKYYKGLGTSTSEEAREYFSDLDEHVKLFMHESAEDDDLIDLAFNSKRADDRKRWIAECREDNIIDHTEPTLTYNDFVKKELVHFAKYDVQRMIPSVVDGLKPGQRKVLFGIFKKKIHGDVKVAQLSGYVAEHSAYHHGETSLQGTIIGMAQTFVGSNNVNLLVPSGQFGTRLQGGKDHAAARYIYTKLSRAARCIFPEEDDAVLEYLNEEGMQIEPKWYCPIIPLVAVNGADGIGVGYSTTVPNYNPREIIANVRRFLRGEEFEPMTPWYRGFKGTVKPVLDSDGSATGKFDVCGVAAKRGRTRLEITELPVRRWTQDYKDWLLEQLPVSGKEHKATITEVREHHTENSVHFIISILPHKLAEAERRGLEKVFHLKSSISTSNMYLFDPEGKIKKYSTLQDIISDFAKVRLDIYEKRKEYMLQKMRKELDLISNKLRFVQLVISERLEVDGRKAAELCRDMRKQGLKWKRDIDGEKGDPLTPEEEAGPLGYRYLLSMKMWSLTDDRLEELKRKYQEKADAIEELEGTELAELWERDLARLEQALDANDREDAKEAEAAARMAAKLQITNKEDLVNKQCVLVLSRNLMAKRVRTSAWKAQRRGAKLASRCGLLDKKETKHLADSDSEAGEGDEEAAAAAPEAAGDALANVFVCHDFDALLVFSEQGSVFMMQALDVPLAKKASAQGTPLKEFLPELGDEHRVAALVTISHEALKDQGEESVVLVSEKGMAKKVSIDKFRSLRPGKGITAMKLNDGDKLRWAHRATDTSALVLASTEGFCLKISLGQDFRSSRAQAPGMKVIKTGVPLASCSIAEMTPEELTNVQAFVARKAERAAAMGQAAAGGEEDEEEGGEEPETQVDGKEAGVDQAEDDKESNDGESDGERPDAEMADAIVPASQATEVAPVNTGPCLLLVTQDGFGTRMSLSEKRLKLARRGGRGARVMKVGGRDQVIGAAIVTGQMAPPKPKDARRPEDLYVDDCRPEIEEELQARKDNGAEGEATLHTIEFHQLAHEKFEKLEESVKQVYEQRAVEDSERHRREMEEYTKRDTDQVLLNSTAGNVSRINVDTIHITKRPNRGRMVVKVSGKNVLCGMSVLSAVEQDAEEPAPENEMPAPIADAPMEEEEGEEDAEKAVAPALKRKPTPRKRVLKQRRSLTLPETPKASKQKGISSAGLAAASLLATPRDDEEQGGGRTRIVGKKGAVSTKGNVKGTLNGTPIRGVIRAVGKANARKSFAQRAANPLKLTKPGW